MLNKNEYVKYTSDLTYNLSQNSFLERLSYTNVSQKINVIEKKSQSIEIISPLTIFDIYYPIIEEFLLEIELFENFYYKPEHLCYYLYNTTSLWWLILQINNCLSHKDFIMKKVKIFNPNKLIELENFLNKHKKLKDTVIDAKNITIKEVII
jgi:hypothetical protein